MMSAKKIFLFRSILILSALLLGLWCGLLLQEGFARRVQSGIQYVLWRGHCTSLLAEETCTMIGVVLDVASAILVSVVIPWLLGILINIKPVIRDRSTIIALRSSLKIFSVFFILGFCLSVSLGLFADFVSYLLYLLYFP